MIVQTAEEENPILLTILVLFLLLALLLSLPLMYRKPLTMRGAGILTAVRRILRRTRRRVRSFVRLAGWRMPQSGILPSHSLDVGRFAREKHSLLSVRR
jgi:hypothetical protein